MLRHYMQTWHLTAPQHLASTATSHVYIVQHHGDTVILKLLTPVGQEDEQGATAALVWFAGHGAIRLLRADTRALLLEYVAGDALTSLVAAGHDDAATDIVADVMAQLYRPVDSAVLPGLRPLSHRFRALFVRAQQEPAAPGAALFVEAAAVAHTLLADQREPCVLHGDLHHENIKYSPQRGWLAIDPKGLIGERAYDAANVLCNPVTLPGLAQSEARLLRQTSRLAARLQIAPWRLLAWVYAHACLAASWSLEEGTAPQHWCSMAHLVRPHVSPNLRRSIYSDL
jgi:streptomycin 6-kinase